MRYQCILLVCLAVPSIVALCNNAGDRPDLPNPPSIVKTLPEGTWIVPMDDKQLDANGLFNLGAYGLIYRFLWANIKVDWIIKGCKTESAVDFTANVRQILPVWNLNTPINQDFSRDFKYGAFAIVHPHFALIPYQNLVQNMTLNFGERIEPPAVYILNEEVSVEVRHNWQMKPRIGVLSGDDKYTIHGDILAASGLIEEYHYFALGVEAQKILDSTSCFTFISNPHDDLEEEPVRAGTVSDFTRSGGNFLAQCHGVRTYGMYAAIYGKKFLLNTPGAGEYAADVTGCNARIESFEDSRNFCPSISDGDGTMGSSGVPYGRIVNADLPFLQFDHGKGFDYDQGGSWIDGDYESIKDYMVETSYIDLTNLGMTNTQTQEPTSVFKAMAGQIIDYTKGPIGGQVYYMAGHKYVQTCAEGTCQLNGRRMYMNAAITPATDRSAGCGLTVKVRRICDYGVCVEFTEKPEPGTVAQEPDAIDISNCPDGNPPRRCPWDKTCGTIPSCLDINTIQNSKLSCFPSYCGTCQAIWQDQTDASGASKVFCDGEVEAEVGDRGTLSPTKLVTSAPTTLSPTKNGETRSPTSPPTSLSPTKEGETRSPTTSKDIGSGTGAEDPTPVMSGGVVLVGNVFMAIVSAVTMILLIV